MDNSTTEGILGIFFILFGFWPLMLLVILRWRKNVLLGMLAIWCGFAVIRVLGFLVGEEIPIVFIPEPLNTVLFFSTGAVLLLIIGMRNGIARWRIGKKVDNARRVEDLRRLSPSEFEELVVELFVAEGHKAKRTGSIGDHGVDVVVKAANGEKWVVQCKRWRGSVGEPVIRDFHGVMQHEKADKGVIITTGTFTPQAREWARGKPISLMEGNQLLSLVQKINQKRRKLNPSSLNTQKKEMESPLCPKCGSQMVLRVARKGPNAGGKFWGCLKFPKCNGIRKHEN